MPLAASRSAMRGPMPFRYCTGVVRSGISQGSVSGLRWIIEVLGSQFSVLRIQLQLVFGKYYAILIFTVLSCSTVTVCICHPERRFWREGSCVSCPASFAVLKQSTARKTSPNPANFIRVESSIVADDGNVFCLGLRDHHTIEWISMRFGQQPCPNRMVICDR